MCLTEQWLKDAQASVYNIDDYSKFIPCNRSWGPRGGVGLYLYKKFKYRVPLKDSLRVTNSWSFTADKFSGYFYISMWKAFFKKWVLRMVARIIES